MILPSHALGLSVGWWLRLWLAAWLTCLLVQVPGVGNVDTSRRLQVTRSLWTAEPPVRDGEYPKFGVPGRNGVIHAWYGLGQSLVMLPADFVAAALEKLFTGEETRRKLRSGVVATLTFPVVNATSVVLAFALLANLGFTLQECLAGTLSFFLGTTFLHYCQVHMENSLQDSLMLADAVLLLRWVKTSRPALLAAAALAAGFSLLIRLPSLAEHAGLWFSALWLRQQPATGWRDKLAGMGWRQIVAIALPIFLAVLAGDRIYHFHRFGNWTGTYIHEYGRSWRSQHPEAAAEFPFSGEFWEGFLGPLVGPDRSMLLYDPLILLLLVACLGCWRQFSMPVRLLLLGGGGGCLLLLSFYARYVHWDGSAAWGNRFTLPPFHLLLLLALPCWRRAFPEPDRRRQLFMRLVLATALATQVASLLMPSSVEWTQQQSGPRQFSLARRICNVANLISGHPAPDEALADAWRINLFPATLGQNRPVLRGFLWAAWALGLASSVYLFGQLWWQITHGRGTTVPNEAH